MYKIFGHHDNSKLRVSILTKLGL